MPTYLEFCVQTGSVLRPNLLSLCGWLIPLAHDQWYTAHTLLLGDDEYTHVYSLCVCASMLAAVLPLVFSQRMVTDSETHRFPTPEVGVKMLNYGFISIQPHPLLHIFASVYIAMDIWKKAWNSPVQCVV